MIHFFTFQNNLNELIQHDAIEIYSNFSFRFDFEWPVFIGGLIFLALAEVFKEGFALKKESELTI